MRIAGIPSEQNNVHNVEQPLSYVLFEINQSGLNPVTYNKGPV